MTNTPTPEVHLGRNIKRLREMLRIKQEALAITLGDDWNQKKVSRLEEKEEIDDELLKEVAAALHVTPEAIKNFDAEAAINYINNFNDNSVNHGAFNNYHCNINPIDKWIEALEENKMLYERLVQAEKEKVEMLERILNEKK